MDIKLYEESITGMLATMCAEMSEIKELLKELVKLTEQANERNDKTYD